MNRESREVCDEPSSVRARLKTSYWLKRKAQVRRGLGKTRPWNSKTLRSERKAEQSLRSPCPSAPNQDFSLLLRQITRARWGFLCHPGREQPPAPGALVLPPSFPSLSISPIPIPQPAPFQQRVAGNSSCHRGHPALFSVFPQSPLLSFYTQRLPAIKPRGHRRFTPDLHLIYTHGPAAF